MQGPGDPVSENEEKEEARFSCLVAHALSIVHARNRTSPVSAMSRFPLTQIDSDALITHHLERRFFEIRWTESDRWIIRKAKRFFWPSDEVRIDIVVVVHVLIDDECISTRRNAFDLERHAFFICGQRDFSKWNLIPVSIRRFGIM